MHITPSISATLECVSVYHSKRYKKSSMNVFVRTQSLVESFAEVYILLESIGLCWFDYNGRYEFGDDDDDEEEKLNKNIQHGQRAWR